MKESEFKKMPKFKKMAQYVKIRGLETSEIAMEKIAELADPLNSQSEFIGSITNPISGNGIFDSYDDFVAACREGLINLKFLKLTNIPTLIINAGIGDHSTGFSGYFNLLTGDQIIESCQSGEFEIYGDSNEISETAKKIDFIYNLKFRV